MINQGHLTRFHYRFTEVVLLRATQKGGVDITRTVDGDTTILKYEAKAQIGGKIAQLGSRSIQSTAKKLAGKFFTSFAKVMEDA